MNSVEVGIIELVELLASRGSAGHAGVFIGPDAGLEVTFSEHAVHVQLHLLGGKANLGTARVRDARSASTLVVEGADLVNADDDLIDLALVQRLLRTEDHGLSLAELRLALHVVTGKVGLAELVVVAGGELHRHDGENERGHKPVIGLEMRDGQVGQIVIGLPALGDLSLNALIGNAHGGLLLSAWIKPQRCGRSAPWWACWPCPLQGQSPAQCQQQP